MERTSESERARYSVCVRSVPQGFSSYRLLDEHGNEIAEANDFLDALAARGLSQRSLRAYGYSLLNFWRWLAAENVDMCSLCQADLLTYIRFQQRSSTGRRKVAATTINHRLKTVCCFYHFHTGQDLPSRGRAAKRRLRPFHGLGRRDLGYANRSRRRQREPSLLVKAPRPVVVPLTSDEVRAFLQSLQSWRDVSIVALMLLCGLRSQEVIDICSDDLRRTDGDILVRGKGNKERVVPLTAQVTSCLTAYLESERPETTAPNFFVCLKGPRRGRPMTPAGLRSLFRYHRRRAKVSKANPHRFRHTFGADMARAGLSMPALMRLMGHASIGTTMLYIELAPRDVWDEFHKVVNQLRGEHPRLGAEGDVGKEKPSEGDSP